MREKDTEREREIVREIVVLMKAKDMHIISKLAMCTVKTKNSEKYGFRGKFC